jgi:hypothetical protein
MIKQTANDPLRELWAVKDETSARFHSAAAYFEHLAQLQGQPVQQVKAPPKKGLARNRRLHTEPAH